MLPDNSIVEEFDVVIVGAGSAGCVLAYRLSQDPKMRVLLIEAGPPDTDPLIHMPRGFGRTLANRGLAWHYSTEPDPTTGEQSELWMRGKTLGGSSSVNGMVYMRGHPKDYDNWVSLGNRGWGWDVMGPIFDRIEVHTERERGGDGARLDISVHPDPDPLCDAFIEAGNQMGLNVLSDLNGRESEGIGYVTRTITRGRRVSAATAFLNPARGRANLRIVTRTTVSRLLLEKGRAVGVECSSSGKLQRYRAAREVILSAGALNSPKILQLSGIGPAGLLRSLGIEPVIENSEVGEHLRDHRLLFLQYRLKTEHSQNRSLSGLAAYANAFKYFVARRGVLSHGAYHVGAFVRTGPELDRPDAEILMAPYSLVRGAKKVAFESFPGMSLFGYPLRPESEGTVMIRSRDPETAPLIRPAWLRSTYDKVISVRMHRFIEQLLKQPALRSFVGERTSPKEMGDTDEEIVQAFISNGQSGYHATGTCRMGPRDEVVDSRLRVRGVGALRVVDLSVMPTMVSGNTNGPAMALAWRAADLIIEDAQMAAGHRSLAVDSA